MSLSRPVFARTYRAQRAFAGHRPAPRFAVLGAGHGGTAMAAHLALKGFAVRLYNRTAANLEAIQDAGGIQLAGNTLQGPVAGFARLERVTADLGEAVDGADLILVTTPASAHGDVARQLARHLLPHQVVVLNPGRTGGALEAARVLAEQDCKAVVAEAQTFVYASRRTGPAEARIYQEKRKVPVAAFPATATGRVLRLLRAAYGQMVPARSVLHTGFENIGAVFHPAPLILNASKVESGQEFDYYHEGITPSVAQVMEQVDAERVAVAAAMGLRVLSARQWMQRAYGVRAQTLLEAIRANAGYAGIRAPRTIEHRYISEDVPTGLVPISAFGKLCGVPTPHIDALILLASSLHGVDYRAYGRNLDRMGLGGLTPREIRTLAQTGSVHGPLFAPWLVPGPEAEVPAEPELVVEA